jgi:AbrB family looped-hinge helix DNA binding protein
MSTNGRVVIPQPLRSARGWTEGSELMLIETGEGVLIGTPWELARAVQARFRQPGESVTDEFLAERRAEASREANE